MKVLMPDRKKLIFFKLKIGTDFSEVTTGKPGY